MSTPVENSSESTTKDNSPNEDINSAARKRRYYHYRLASESPIDINNDTESIDSVQNKETVIVGDTSDTSNCSDFRSLKSDLEVNDHYDVGSEYDIPDPWESEKCSSFSTTEPDNIIAAPTVVCKNDLEEWAADDEASDNSSEVSSSGFVFDKCQQCNTLHLNLNFPYCEKCFQTRKSLYPPRPQRTNRRKKLNTNPIHLSMLQDCLSRLSQEIDEDFKPYFPELDLGNIYVVVDSRDENGLFCQGRNPVTCKKTWTVSYNDILTSKYI